jgi:hypothetical protein
MKELPGSAELPAVALLHYFSQELYHFSAFIPVSSLAFTC